MGLLFRIVIYGQKSINLIDYFNNFRFLWLTVPSAYFDKRKGIGKRTLTVDITLYFQVRFCTYFKHTVCYFYVVTFSFACPAETK